MIQAFDLDAEKSKVFLKYFFKKQKDNVLEALLGGGQRFINSDGNYEFHLEYSFKIEEKDVKIYWIILTSKDNCLLSISTVDTDEILDNKLYKMINNCLMEYINDVKTPYYKRSYYSIISGCNLAGEYWFNGIRIAPLFVDDNSQIVNSERIIVIDQVAYAIDNDEANKLAVENAENIVSLLSFIMDISIEEPVQKYIYVLDEDFQNFSRKNSYFIDDKCPLAMPQKNILCKTARFEGSIFKSHENIYHFNNVLKLPSETRRIINRLFNGDKGLRNAVLNFSKIYRISKYVGLKYSTSEIAYQCAGIESISKFAEEKSFSDFMTKYVGKDDKLYSFIYGHLRSGHFHSGEFDFYDFSINPNMFHNPEVQTNYNIKKICHIAMRLGFLNWLNNEIRFLEEK